MQDGQWYNDDDHFEKAVKGVLAAKRGVMQPTTRLLLMEKHLMPAARGECAGGIAKLLCSDEESTRWGAVNGYGDLKPQAQSTHASEIIMTSRVMDTFLPNLVTTSICEPPLPTLHAATKARCRHGISI